MSDPFGKSPIQVSEDIHLAADEVISSPACQDFMEFIALRWMEGGPSRAGNDERTNRRMALNYAIVRLLVDAGIEESSAQWMQRGFTAGLDAALVVWDQMNRKQS